VTGGAARILPSENSPAFLPDTGPLRRPRFALRRRPQTYVDAYESHALFYDCFWHHDGRRVLLVGPPPVNLDYTAIAFRAVDNKLASRTHVTASVCITELADVPAGTREIRVSFSGHDFVLPVQPNSCADLSGSRLIFTINKNNELSWIREWALWHARHHAADAVVLVDNASTRYDLDELRATLAAVPGIRNIALHSWPYKFGPIDPAVFNFPEWSRFLQLCSMSMVLRRYGMLSHALLDCDIDELATTRSGTTAFDVAKHSPGGLVVCRGTWVEALPERGYPPSPSHRAYRHIQADPKKALSPQRKWALDPSRPWVQQLSVHPYWHWVEGRSRDAKSMPADLSYFHFRGINTNWKDSRTTPPVDATVRSAVLDRGFEGLES
jgi:hypothetical protein